MQNLVRKYIGRYVQNGPLIILVLGLM